MAETQAAPKPGTGPAANRQSDPFEAFRQMRDTYMDVMSKSMVEAVNTEAYAKSTGALLQSTLSVAAPMRQAMNQSMVQALEQLSLPSRDDLMRLADRFTNMEMRLDDIDAQLGRIEAALQRPATPPAAAQPVPACDEASSALVEPEPAPAPMPAHARMSKQQQKQQRQTRGSAANQKA